MPQMPQFERCPEPPAPQDLAVNVIADPVEAFCACNAVYVAHSSYWLGQSELADEALSAGASRWSEAFLRAFGEVSRDIFKNARQFTMTDETVRRMYGTVALSQLARDLFSTEAQTDTRDAHIIGRPTVLPERMHWEGDQLVDARLHTTPILVADSFPGSLPEGPTDTWWRAGDLYVRQQFPAQPSPSLQTGVLIRSMDVDFSQLQTSAAPTS